MIKVCCKCHFRIYDDEWELYKECGQCGCKKYKEVE